MLKKYRILTRKKPYQRLLPPSENSFNDFTGFETVEYNNDTSISDLNDTASGPKNNKNAQIAPKKIVQRYKKLAKNKAPVPFNISDVADAKTIDYNKDTNINEVLSSKSVQAAAKKIINKYDNLRRKRKSTLDISKLDGIPSSKKNKGTSLNNRNKNAQIGDKKVLEKNKKYHAKRSLSLSI